MVLVGIKMLPINDNILIALTMTRKDLQGREVIHRDDCIVRENLAWSATYLLKEPNEGELPLQAVLPECLRGFRTFGHGEIR